jgi:signal transduction histidine kinase
MKVDQLFEALVIGSGALVWRMDENGGLLEMAPAAPARGFESWLGFGCRESVHPDDLDRVTQAWDRARLCGELSEITYRALRHGEHRWMTVRGTPAPTGDGRFHWVGLLTDIHETVTAKESLQKTERLEAIGRLTAGVAHDFNNLLTVIASGAEALVDGLEASHPLRAQAALTLHAAGRGAELVSGLLAFSRQQPLRPRPVDLDALLARAAPMIQRTLGEDVEVRLGARDSGLGCLVDPAQLENALINLCINARDAMPSGGRVTIEAKAVSVCDAAAGRLGLKAGEHVLLTVTDEGCGMSPETLEHAIEPFFTTKAGRGSGLGLSMVYGFVSQSEGRLEISSAEGAGTCVRLHLPRVDVGAAPAEPEARAPTPDALAIRVLLVEDDDLVRDQLTRQLTQMGCQVTAAAAGPEALAAVRAGTPFELLMTDIIMPGGLNGFEVAEAVQRLRPGTPVLFTSGYSDERVRSAGRRANARVLQKPYRRAALARALAEAVAEPA